MNQIDLNRRMAVVTGDGSGIGYASAERFLRSGATVELWERNPGKLEDARAALAPLGQVTAQVVDVSQWPEADAAAQRMLTRHGKVDILFNCAGTTDRGAGVIVNAIAPTLFDTSLAQATLKDAPEAMKIAFDKIPTRRMGHPEEAAAMAAWLASAECAFTTGLTFDLSGGRATY